MLESTRDDDAVLEARVFCPLLNVSECDLTTASDSFVVDVWNPLSRAADQWMRLPVKVESASTRFAVVTPYGQVRRMERGLSE